MVWENPVFTNGSILYAESLDVLQNNIVALAVQDNGAPKINVSCLDTDLLYSEIASISALTVSDFDAGISVIDSASIDDLQTHNIVGSGFQSDVASCNFLTTSKFITDVGSLNHISVDSIQVNSSIHLAGLGMYPCRAWVNFDGTGTVSIKDDENVSSIGDNGTGLYTINFTNNMPNSNYVVCITGLGDTGVSIGVVDGQASVGPDVKTLSQVRIRFRTDDTTALDVADINVIVVGK